MRLPSILLFLTLGTAWAQNTVAVSGRITDAVTGLPIENATVALTQGGGDGGLRQVAYADAGGTYSIEDVTPGAGRVDIRAEGFLAFQKTNPDQVTIQIAADHAPHNFALTPAASIMVTVVDRETHLPMQSTFANLLREDYNGGVKHFTKVSTASGYGSFYFAGLEAGNYVILAGPQELGTPGGAVRYDTIFINSGVGGSRTYALRNGDTAAGREHEEGYTDTYYPDAISPADALPVSLATGEKRTVDFSLVKRPLWRVSGELGGLGTDDGFPYVIIEPAGSVSDGLTYGVAANSGAFAVAGLPPGQYSISAKVFQRRGLEGKTSFVVTDHDVEGLRIVLQETTVTDGHFRVESDRSGLPPGLSLLFAYPLPDRQPDAVPVADTGAFWLNDFPGDYSIQASVPAGFAATGVIYGGVNYLNSLIPMKGGSLDIVLTDRPGGIVGSVVDGDLKPVQARIVLVPEPLPSNFDLRAIRVANSGADGSFAFGGLAPGRYKAITLTGEDRKRDHDSAILGERLRGVEPIDVSAGQSASVTIRR
jgi:hypothetical protein